MKRDSTIEKQTLLLEFPHELKVSPLHHDWLCSLNQEKGELFEFDRGEWGYERHLVYLIIRRGNCFSIIKSRLCNSNKN